MLTKKSTRLAKKLASRLFSTVLQETMKQVHVKTRKEWREWLNQNHGKNSGIWLVFYKKHTGKASLEYDEAVEEAARLANIHEFIATLMDGYATEILEDGANLSVGQRQLISIARAVLADPRILIMDEATSSVDMVTETLIQEALQQLLQGRTAIVIAHRLSTIVNADLIAVIEDGHIVELGQHQTLLEQNGLYQHLYERSFVNGIGEKSRQENKPL